MPYWNNAGEEILSVAFLLEGECSVIILKSERCAPFLKRCDNVDWSHSLLKPAYNFGYPTGMSATIFRKVKMLISTLPLNWCTRTESYFDKNFLVTRWLPM